MNGYSRGRFYKSPPSSSRLRATFWLRVNARTITDKKRRCVYAFDPLGQIVGYTETGLSSLEGGASGQGNDLLCRAPSGTLHQK
jgi:hypothetical protein